MMGLKGRHESACRVYDTDYISPCITTMGGGGTEPKIAEKTTAAAMRGRNGKQCMEISDREEANAITTVEKDSLVSEARIRKLTPKECWRLMGFSDEDFEKAQKVNSDSQLYKQAGNSIVVDVLMAIFNEML